MLSGRLRPRLALVFVVGAAVGSYGLPSTFSRGGSSPNERPPEARRAEDAYARLPMSFVANRGQMPEGIAYGARGIGYSLGLAAAEAVFVLSGPAGAGSSEPKSPDLTAGRASIDRPAPEQALLRMQLVGADPGARPDVDLPLPGKANYLVGDDPGRWQTGVPTYGRVTFEAVYPGVDVSYHGNQGQLEYDFVVAPGADPSAVNLAFAGAQGTRVDEHGDLVLTVAGAELRQHAPVIYQDGVGGRMPVPGGFVVREDDSVGFAIGAYDPTRTLVIDPTLAYSTYLGAAGFELGSSIAVDNRRIDAGGDHEVVLELALVAVVADVDAGIDRLVVHPAVGRDAAPLATRVTASEVVRGARERHLDLRARPGVGSQQLHPHQRLLTGCRIAPCSGGNRVGLNAVRGAPTRRRGQGEHRLGRPEPEAVAHPLGPVLDAVGQLAVVRDEAHRKLGVGAFCGRRRGRAFLGLRRGAGERGGQSREADGHRYGEDECETGA